MPITKERFVALLEAGEQLWTEAQDQAAALESALAGSRTLEELQSDLYALRAMRRREPPGILLVERAHVRSTFTRNERIKRRQAAKRHFKGQQFEDPDKVAALLKGSTTEQRQAALRRQAEMQALQNAPPPVELPKEATPAPEAKPNPSLAAMLQRQRELEADNAGFVDPMQDLGPNDGLTLADLTAPPTSADLEAYAKFNNGAPTDDSTKQ